MRGRLVLTLGPDDWARSRFVRSLLFETAQAVRTLLDPGKQQHHRSWLDTLDRPAARARLPILAALNPAAGWIPDFLAPPPRSDERGIEDELAEIAAFPPEMIARDLRRSLDSHPTRARSVVLKPLIADPAAALALVAAEMRWAWTVLVEPHWPAVRELISADTAFRSRQIARSGLGRALGDLDPSVTWRDGTITVEPASVSARVDVAGHGLALMPSAFVWPGVIVSHEPPWPTTIVYPARGIGDLWSAPPPAPAGLAGALGHTRALLLTDLTHPATTTALAARHGLSPATVSVQLGRLRDAGLVAGQRLGKEVHYRRTPLGDALARAHAAGLPKDE